MPPPAPALPYPPGTAGTLQPAFRFADGITSESPRHAFWRRRKQSFPPARARRRRQSSVPPSAFPCSPSRSHKIHFAASPRSLSAPARLFRLLPALDLSLPICRIPMALFPLDSDLPLVRPPKSKSRLGRYPLRHALPLPCENVSRPIAPAPVQSVPGRKSKPGSLPGTTHPRAPGPLEIG